MRESTTDSEITLSGSLDSYFPAPYRLSDGPSPRKRPRTASRTPSRPPSRGPSSTPSEVNYAREESTLRLFDAWSSIAERYSRPLGEDDEVDLRTGNVIKDRGFLRSTPRVAFGAFIPDEQEEPDEDDFDELDAFGESRRVGGWSVPPVRTTDPEDARELEEFLEAERASKIYGVEEDEEEEDEEDVSDGYGSGEEQEVDNEGEEHYDYEEELRDGKEDEEEQEVESVEGEEADYEEEAGDEVEEAEVVENEDGDGEEEEGDEGDNVPRNNAIASTSRLSKPQSTPSSRSSATTYRKADDAYDSDDEFGAYRMDEASAVYRIVDREPTPYVEDDYLDDDLNDDEPEYAELPPSSSSVPSSPIKSRRKYPNIDFIDLTSDGPDSPPSTPSPAKRPTKHPTIDFIDLSPDDIPNSTPSRIRKEPIKPPARPAFLQLATPPRSSSLSSPPPRGLFRSNRSPKAQHKQKYTHRTVSKGKGKGKAQA
ncbi:hypothetical protein CCMSSC00406_0007745 [Pleurotus cornucopiae]|uniref:Uncharacterized protein n=1 Tax=Pleurotus cornucopiae TaxID=5321 RepID=A0ACB7J012_PLECO|nr:hypothetical protein CCMSSC00406_0007745 [Pleurotus cornucopiae]